MFIVIVRSTVLLVDLHFLLLHFFFLLVLDFAMLNTSLLVDLAVASLVFCKQPCVWNEQEGVMLRLPGSGPQPFCLEKQKTGSKPDTPFSVNVFRDEPLERHAACRVGTGRR